MNKLVMVLSAALGLHASFAAHSAELMATVTSSKGTTRIETVSAKNAYFLQPYVINTKLTGGDIYKGSYYLDLLLPAGTGASQLTVSNGYCAVVASAPGFTGSKPRVFGPGSHTIKSYPYFTNGIQGLAVYANSGASCNLRYDLPLLTSADGKNSLPVAPRPSTLLPIIDTPGEIWFANSFFHTTHFPDDRYIVGLADFFSRLDHSYSFTGQFPYKNSILTVPACHKVSMPTRWESAGEYLTSTDYPTGPRKVEVSAIKEDCKKPNNVQRSAKGGVIRHNGNNLCLNPEGGGVPTYDTRAVLTSNCSATDPGNKFRMLFDGTIQHVESGMCLHPRGGSSKPGNGTELVFWPACGAQSGRNGAYIRFENTLKDSLRQLSSGSCLHPNGGSPTPANGTKVVFWQGCNEDRLRFTFDAQ